jgi:hypothetical protein
MYDTQASRCALYVCVCVYVCVCLFVCLVSPAPVVSCTALLVVVVLWLATSFQVSVGIHLPCAYRISRRRSRATLLGLRDTMLTEHVCRY